MKKLTPFHMIIHIILLTMLSSNFLLAGCSAEPPMPKELVLYNWVDYMPQSVMYAFTKEHGITIKYVAYGSQEEVPESIEAGSAYDLVVLGPEFIPELAEKKLLKTIDYRNVPNFKHVSANFRDLAFDPGNKYSIPFHWGTTGILVRTDNPGDKSSQERSRRRVGQGGHDEWPLGRQPPHQLGRSSADARAGGRPYGHPPAFA